MLSQNDIRLSQLALAEKLITPQQLQDILRDSKAQKALKQRVPLLVLLKELTYITPEIFERLLAKHILIQCTSCAERSLILGPKISSGTTCVRCQGELKIIPPASLSQTPPSNNPKGILSQNDIRLSQFAISEKLLTTEQFQEILRNASIREGLKRGSTLLQLLKELNFLNQTRYEILLVKHILVRCKNCQIKTQILGPEIPSGYTCDYCGGDIELASASSSPAFIRSSPSETTPSSKTASATLFSPSSGKPASSTIKTSEKSSASEDIIGQVIGGCQILRKIGQGGMGSVYLGEHLGLKNRVAVKLLPPNSVNPEMVSRFYQEARSIARIDHPNVVRVQDVGEKSGRYYLVMQFIDGNTFESEIQQKGSIHWIRATKTIRAVAQGLQAAHDENIVHCDVKPENIMMPTKGQAKITDFGLAQDLHGPSISNFGKVIGTSYFMSPEQCNGLEVDWRTDIYSLGISFYYAITGQKPFVGFSLTEIMMKHLHDAPKPPSEKVADLPPLLEQMILKMLSKDPAKRYASMTELIKELSSVLAKKKEGEDFEELSSTNIKVQVSPRPSPKSETRNIAKTSLPLPLPLPLAIQKEIPIEQRVSQLAKDFKNANPQIRIRSISELGKLGQSAEIAILALIQVLKDEDKNVRKTVVSTLSSLGRESENIRETLKEAVQDDNWVIRAYLAEVFGGLGTDLVSTLIQLLKDEHWVVRAHAAEALSGIGREAKEAIPALISALRSQDWAIKKSASQALAGIGEEAIPELIQVLQEQNSDLNNHLLPLLQEIGSENISTFCDAISKAEDPIKIQLLNLLKEMGEKGRASENYLKELLLKTSSPALSQKLEETWKKVIGKELPISPKKLNLSASKATESNTEVIHSFLNDLNNAEQEAIVRRETQKLKLKEEKEAILTQKEEEFSSILEQIQEEEFEDLSDDLKTDTMILRNDQELKQLLEVVESTPISASSPILLPVAKGGHSLEEEFQVSLLPEAVQIKIQELQEEDEDVRINALEALEKVRNPAILPYLIEVLKDEQRQIRERVVQILVQMLPELPLASIETLIRGLQHSDWVVRVHIIKILGKLGTLALKAIPAMIQTLQDPHWVIRKHIAEALGQIGKPAKDAIPALQKALTDEDSFVRKEAVLALEKIKGSG
ncbi:MAG: HEAT repeat domain-containing protein [Planctomycetota bacterium]